MLLRVAAVARHDALDERGERLRRQNGRLFTLRNDGARDFPGKALFAVVGNHAPQLRLRSAAEPLGCGFAARRVHAHVERSVKAEGKAPRGIVDLRGGNADVKENAIDGADPDRAERFAHG